MAEEFKKGLNETIFKIVKNQYKSWHGLHKGRVFPLSTPNEIKYFIVEIMCQPDWHLNHTDILSDLFIMLNNFHVKKEMAEDAQKLNANS